MTSPHSCSPSDPDIRPPKTLRVQITKRPDLIRCVTGKYDADRVTLLFHLTERCTGSTIACTGLVNIFSIETYSSIRGSTVIEIDFPAAGNWFWAVDVEGATATLVAARLDAQDLVEIPTEG